MANKKGFHPQVIERYLLSQLLMYFLMTTLALGVLVSGRLFATLLGKISGHSFPADLLFQLWFYGTLKPLSLLMPFTAMIAVLLTFARLYKRAEAYAMFGAGVSYRRVYATILRFALPLTMFLLVFELFLSPIVEQRYQALKDMGRERMDTSVVTEGQFLYPRDNLVLFVNQVDGNELTGIFATEYDSEKDSFTTEIAQRGVQSVGNGGHFLDLHDGERYYAPAGGEGYHRLAYENHRIPIVSPSYVAKPDFAVSAASVSELIAIGNDATYAELQKRFSIPLATLLLALVAFPLSYTPPRSNHQIRIIAGLLVFLVYYGGLIVVRREMARGNFPLIPGLTLLHGLLAVVTPLLFYRDKFMHVVGQIMERWSGRKLLRGFSK